MGQKESTEKRKLILCYICSQNKNDAFSNFSKPFQIFMKGIKCAQNSFLPTARHFQPIFSFIYGVNKHIFRGSVFLTHPV